MKLLYKIFLLAMLPFGFMAQTAEAQNAEQRTLSVSDKKVTAYPIPANSAVYLRISPALRSEAKTVELVNLIGKTVAAQSINSNDAGDIVFGGLSQLPEGVYIGVMKNAEGKIIQTAKLMIQH